MTSEQARHAAWCPKRYDPPADGGGSSWLCCCTAEDVAVEDRAAEKDAT